MSENQNLVLNQDLGEDNVMETKYTTPVITVKPEASIFETLQKMQTNFIKRIVVAVNKKPLGIVTERDINKFLENDKTAKAIDEIPVKHVMQKNIISIADGVDDHFAQCAARMDTFRIGSIVLVNDDGELIGVVSRTDIAKAFSTVYGGKYRVKEFMSKKSVTCRKSDSLKLALNLMNSNEVSRLVVTDEKGNPVGLVTTNTFLNHSDYFTKGHTRTRDYLLPVNSDKLTVADLLSKDLLTIDQEDDLATAAILMIKNKISGIPVTDSDKNLVGVVTKSDIVRAFTVVNSHEELRAKYKELY